MSEDTLSDAIKKSLAEESVDDILAEIINTDGSFNEGYNGLYARYLGIPEKPAVTDDYDLSDRRGDVVPGMQVEYENESMNDEPLTESDASVYDRLGGKDGAYYRQVSEFRRPEFTSSGDVKYPSIGSGAAEERVVYDADWETRAKEEAERAFRYGNERTYRGITGNGSFVAGGRDLARESYRPQIRQSSSPFVDPISDDEDFNRYWQRQYEQSQKKSFFQEGLRTSPRSETVGAQDRYTERDSHNSGHERQSNSDWLNVEGGKRRRRKRKDRSAIPDTSPLSRTVYNQNLRSTGIIKSKDRVTQRTYITRTERDATQAELESLDLRNSVAEIVSKYDKKAQEEQLARAKAEKERVERKKKEEQEKALKAAKKAKNRIGVSELLVEALDKEEEAENSNQIYDDFSDDAEDGFENI